MIDLDAIDVTFGRTRVIAGLSLAVREGEFFTLLGPSGCGKTTLLRTISGFVAPSAGRVVVGGRDVTDLPPEDRGIGVVFQNYALFPHLTAYDNIAFGLRTARAPRATIRAEVAQALDRIGVAPHAQKKPAELSGGQQQRVAIARALILGTSVLLLDEPLSNLDAKLRETMREEIRDIQRRGGLTAVYVTHDQTEALAISDRIAVMRDGVIQQIGSPRDLYDRPSNAFVCTFVGETSRLPPGPGIPGTAYVRPEHIRLGDGGDGTLRYAPVLERATFQGARQRLHLRLGDARLLAEAPAAADVGSPGDPLPVWIAREHIHTYPEAAE